MEDVSYTVLSPIESALRSVAKPAADIVTRYGDVRDLTRENEALRSQNELLNAEVARLREEATRQEELERLLETRNELADHDVLLARVISREPNNQRQMVAIDRGSSDGLRVGMPVVTEGRTLVGTISKVEGDHSWITLVTDIDSAVSSHVLESRAQGVVEGNYDGSLSMAFVDQNAAIKEGDTIVTSGIGGGYPVGLVVGRVTSVGGNPQELFQSVAVTPLASLSRLENVLVITTFTPREISDP